MGPAFLHEVTRLFVLQSRAVPSPPTLWACPFGGPGGARQFRGSTGDWQGCAGVAESGPAHRLTGDRQVKVGPGAFS